MATTEYKGAAPFEESDYRHEALTMALAILVERIRRLSDEDREELWTLMKELPSEDGPEERNAIVKAMREILDQAPVKVTRLELNDDAAPAPSLQRWIDYVSKRIKELRVVAGLTQTELAERAGLPQSHISRLESGKHSPSRVTLEKIAGALGRPLKDLDPSE
jgi:DNA-binding XRE family transcriptional regulator